MLDRLDDPAAALALIEGHVRAGHDPDALLALAALAAHRAGQRETALAHAWRAAWRTGEAPETVALLARALDAVGLSDLADRRLARAIAHRPEDARLRLERFVRLCRGAPEEARRALGTLSAVAGPERLGPVLRRLPSLGLARLGACRAGAGRIEGWAATVEGVRDGVVARWCSGGEAREAVLLDLAETDRVPRRFALDWPEGACDVAILWRSDGTPLEGGRLARIAPPRPSDTALSPVVDVIVPVYAGRAETLACLASVFEAVGETPFELVVVDDLGPDPELRADLRRLADEGRITLLVNPVNRGFTASANRGLALHPDRDAVLLNADAAVAPGWLDRLARAARSDPAIATATPFTNNGQIVSYPAPYRDGPFPGAADIARLDAVFARENAGVTVDLPTGIGFCLYLRRAGLDAVGLLDDQAFGRGYSEEVDFCRRAAALGWRHVCAADVFVGHVGTASFGIEKAHLVARNERVLAERHPDYAAVLGDFLRRDPLAPARRRAERALLAAGGTPGPVAIPLRGAGPLGAKGRDVGGVAADSAAATPIGAPAACVAALSTRSPAQRTGAVLAVCPRPRRDWPAAAILAEAARDAGLRVLWLSPVATGSTLALEPEGAPASNLVYRVPEDLDALRRDVGVLAPEAAYLGAAALPTGLARAIDALGLPETLFLIEPDVLAALEGRAPWPEAAVRERVGRACGLRVGDPALAVALSDRVSAEIALWSMPAVDTPPLARCGPISARVVVVDGGDEPIGFARLLSLAHEAGRSGSSLDFVVLGRSLDDAALARTGRVRVLGPVAVEERGPLARARGAGVALALGQPELPLALGARAALATGLVAAVIGGRDAARLGGLPGGVDRLDPTSGPRAWLARLDALADLARDPRAGRGRNRAATAVR
ncbi:MAG: glycosyltransferase family 2 protein [Paracoccaceae bacterium]